VRKEAAPETKWEVVRAAGTAAKRREGRELKRGKMTEVIKDGA